MSDSLRHRDRQVCDLLSSLALSLALLCAGCSGSGSSVTAPPPGLPTPPTPGTANSYVGTQSPGLWSVTIDDAGNQFSYQALTYPQTPNVPISGPLTNAGGFLKLSQPDGHPAGFALEMPGSAVLLRPGDLNTPLVVGVQQNICYAINGKARFQFLPISNSLNEGGTPSYGVYGSVVANTDASGDQWNFTDAVGGNRGPSSFNGNCKAAQGNAQITAPQTATYNTPSIFVIGESGFFIEDFGAAGTPQNQVAASFAGLLQPPSTISAAGIAAGSYLGFIASNQNQLAAFGLPATGGKNLVGGVFPNDDPTQTANSDTTLALGTQDPSNNGYFPNASLTYPDPTQACQTNASLGTPGIDQNGNPTCTSAAVAIVGSSGSKYQVYVNSTTATIQMYLFQQ